MTSISPPIDRSSADVPIALFYDNRPEEVEDHERAAARLGYRAITVTEIPALLDAVDDLRNGSKVFLDQHNPDVPDLSAIGLPEISTDKGLRVGLALARGVLPSRTPSGVDIYIMSMYEVTNSADDEMAKAISRGQVSRFVRKRELDDFTAALSEGRSLPWPEDSSADGSVIPELQRYRQGVKSAIRIVEEWASGDMALVMACFGWPGRSPNDWSRTRASMMDDLNSDIAKRVEAIQAIKKVLLAIYREEASIEKEIAWLRASDEHLGGRSPWELIVSSQMLDLVLVVNLVRKLS